MTPHDMPAGAEMDRMVVAKVMQWKHAVRRILICFPDEHMDCDGWEDKRGRFRVVEDEDCWSERAFRPSLMITHAFEVVEALRARGFLFSITSFDNCGKWAVQIAATHERDRRVTSTVATAADTLPLALCRAALLAVGAA